MNKAAFAGLLLALSGAALAQVDPGRVVATVNGVEIKGAEYYRRMEFLPGVGRDIGSGFAEFPPGFLTLEQLITERLVYQLAKKKGVMPTDPEVEAEIRNRLGDNPKMIDDWTAAGRTRDELFESVKFDLAQFKVLTAGINVTDQEVDDFYKSNKEQFTTPRQAQLRVIVVRSQADADTVDKELSGGKPFADVAKAHSVDVTAGSGGAYGRVPVSYLNEDVRKALNSVKIGSTTPWFEAGANSGGAKFKFLLEAVVPEALRPMTPELRRQTRLQIMMQRGKVKNHVKEELDAMRAQATIDIKQKEFAEAYKKFLEAYLKTGKPGG